MNENENEWDSRTVEDVIPGRASITLALIPQFQQFQGSEMQLPAPPQSYHKDFSQRCRNFRTIEWGVVHTSDW